MILKTMWGIANTDEEYRAILKRREHFIPLLLFAGAAAIVVSFFLLRSGEEKAFLSGLYMGIGCGMLGAGAIWLLKIRSMLRDGKKLREKRLKEFDERNIQVINKAHNTAGVLLVMTGYAVLLAAGFFSMEVFWTVWAFIMVYFVFFLVSRVIYEKKM